MSCLVFHQKNIDARTPGRNRSHKVMTTKVGRKRRNNHSKNVMNTKIGRNKIRRNKIGRSKIGTHTTSIVVKIEFPIDRTTENRSTRSVDNGMAGRTRNMSVKTRSGATGQARLGSCLKSKHNVRLKSNGPVLYNKSNGTVPNILNGNLSLCKQRNPLWNIKKGRSNWTREECFGIDRTPRAKNGRSANNGSDRVVVVGGGAILLVTTMTTIDTTSTRT